MLFLLVPGFDRPLVDFPPLVAEEFPLPLLVDFPLPFPLAPPPLPFWPSIRALMAVSNCSVVNTCPLVLGVENPPNGPELAVLPAVPGAPVAAAPVPPAVTTG